MTVAPHWYKRFSKEPYTKEQMTKIIEILFSAASIAIDKLIDPNYEIQEKTDSD